MTCVFCSIAAGHAAASMIWQDDRFLAFLDLHPIRAGHALVIPRRHAPRLADVGDEAAALFGHAVRIVAAVRASGLPCDDVNVVLNDGRAANQTVAHAHVHVVPRVDGDLPRLARKLLQRPLERWLGPPTRAELDRHAAMIRAAL